MSVDCAFAEGAPGDREDQSLVQCARAGDRDALEALIKRHQCWIYNIVRMLFHPQDAEDATQEILIKILTRLSSFEGRSTFRTWLYRIVVPPAEYETIASRGPRDKLPNVWRGARQDA